jgi:hypothetical protein
MKSEINREQQEAKTGGNPTISRLNNKNNMVNVLHFRRNSEGLTSSKRAFGLSVNKENIMPVNK